MKYFRSLLVLVLLQSAAWFTPAQAMTNHNTPVAVATDLYETAYLHFGPRPKNVKLVQPYLAPKLFARLWYKVKQPASGPQKDVFFCSETPPADYSIGKVVTNGNSSKVQVDLAWLGKNGPKTQVWVLLKQNDGVWQVDDIDYGIFGRLSNYL